MSSFFLYPVLGCFAGLIAGLFGVGGGMVIVPVLVFTFTAMHFSPAVLTHLAIGTSLATIIVTSLSAIHAHHGRGAVEWVAFRGLAPGLLPGAFAGAHIARLIPGRELQILIGGFALLVALQFFTGWKGRFTDRPLPGAPGLGVSGSLIGTASAVVGIGGGTFTVPFLTWHGIPMARAVATASACGLPIALAGAFGFVTAGHNLNGLPEGAWGLVYWPAFAGIAATSLVFARIGAKLAHYLPANVLRKLFAGLLTLVGLSFLHGG